MDLDRPLAPTPYTTTPPVPSFDLTSDDIADGQTLQAPFTAAGNTSPQLSWTGFPPQTASFLVTCFDPDAPTASGYWHWAVVDVPASTTDLPRGAGTHDDALLPQGAFQLVNDGGSVGYAGAWPPRGDRVHRYVFAVHALDVAHLDVDASTPPADAAAAAVPHTVARAVVVPLFQR